MTSSMARYRQKHRRFDYVPSADALKIIERHYRKGQLTLAGVIDSLILAGAVKWLPQSDAQAGASPKARAGDAVLIVAMYYLVGANLSALAKHCGWVNSAGVPQKYKVARAMARLHADKLVKKSILGCYLLTPKGLIVAKDHLAPL